MVVPAPLFFSGQLASLLEERLECSGVGSSLGINGYRCAVDSLIFSMYNDHESVSDRWLAMEDPMTKMRREREKERRRLSILQAARTVFFERGFYRATVDEIARRAEISKGTVYLYFESKEAILAHLLLEGLRELVGELERAYAAGESLSAEERLRRLGWAYFRFFQREPVYYRFMMAMDHGRFRETVSAEIYRQLEAISMEGLEWVVRAVEQGMADGELDCEDARRTAAVLWAVVNGALELVEHPLRRALIGLECEALYQTVTETVIRGLRAR